MISQLFRIDANESTGKTQSEKRGSSLYGRLHSILNSKLNETTNEHIDHTKLKPMKMLFFNCLPKAWRARFNRTRFRCFRRSLKYRLLEDGNKRYVTEIDVVKVIRDQRWIRVGVKALLKLQSAEFRQNVRAQS